MKKELFFAVLSLIIVLTACDSQRIYEENKDFEDRVWPYDSTASFTFEIKDTTQMYNIYYNVRNSLDYPYHNLYLNYTLQDSTFTTLSEELNDMSLFDSKTGAPQGDGLGDIFDHQVCFLEGFRFQTPGTYHIKIQQFMRMDTLPEIMSIGLRIERQHR